MTQVPTWRVWLSDLVDLYPGVSVIGGDSQFKSFIFKLKLTLHIDILSISYEIPLRLMPQNDFDDESVLVRVMTWCHSGHMQWHHLAIMSDCDWWKYFKYTDNSFHYLSLAECLNLFIAKSPCKTNPRASNCWQNCFIVSWDMHNSTLCSLNYSVYVMFVLLAAFCIIYRVISELVCMC